MRGYRAGCPCSSSLAASSSFPGWHHIVAAQTGQIPDRPLRSDDVWMKTTGWLGEYSGLAAGVHFIGMCQCLTEGERHVPFR
jgi:hypothetical protein